MDEAQAETKTAGRNINNLRYADDTTPMAESEEELMSLLMKVKEKSEKAGLKLIIQKTKIMASGPITSWQIGKKWKKKMAYFIFLGSKITRTVTVAMKLRHLLLERKAMTNLDSVLKSRDITLLTNGKGPSSQSYGFPSSHVQMWELDHKEGWVPKNCCFWTVVLEKTRESLGQQGDQTSQS